MKIWSLRLGPLRGICLAMLLPLWGCMGIPLDEVPPAGFDLSGVWQLIEEGSDTARAGRSTGFITQDFPMLVARELKIEQDARSMGIEYARGSYRDVSWGERRRGVWDVRAGWHEGDLHIYSETPDTSAGEIWQLSVDASELTVDVEIKAGRTYEFRRRFRRI